MSQISRMRSAGTAEGCEHAVRAPCAGSIRGEARTQESETTMSPKAADSLAKASGDPPRLEQALQPAHEPCLAYPDLPAAHATLSSSVSGSSPASGSVAVPYVLPTFACSRSSISGHARPVGRRALAAAPG